MALAVTTGDWAGIGSCGYFRLGYTAPDTGVAIEEDFQLFFDAHGESITYRPRAGVPRLVLAVVQRMDEAQSQQGSPSAMAPNIEIWVQNAETAIADDVYGGISEDEVDTGGDQVDLPVRRGQTAQTRRVAEVLNADAGMLHLRIT